MPVRIVSSGSPEVAPSKYKPPKPRLYLEGKHAQALLKKGKVGQSITATVRGRITEMSTRRGSEYDGGGMRHSATLEIDHTSCGGRDGD